MPHRNAYSEPKLGCRLSGRVHLWDAAEPRTHTHLTLVRDRSSGNKTLPTTNSLRGRQASPVWPAATPVLPHYGCFGFRMRRPGPHKQLHFWAHAELLRETASPHRPNASVAGRNCRLPGAQEQIWDRVQSL